MPTKLFISNAVLKDYRTIKNCGVDLKNGLNVIIGKNGTGKTTFLNYLFSSINESYDSTFRYYNSEIEFTGSHTYKIFQNKSTIMSPEYVPQEKFERRWTVDGVDKDEDKSKWREDIYKQEGVYLSTRIIRHGIPEKVAFWSAPVSVRFSLSSESERHVVLSEMLSAFISSNSGGYISNFMQTLIILAIIEYKDHGSLSDFANRFKDSIIASCEKFTSTLKKYSPIEGIQISESFRIEIDDDSKTLHFVNFFFEFNVNGEWFSFDQLSDGTKRVLAIISDLSNDLESSTVNIRAEIYFIEEPELGVHPHQLHQLLAFLKECSSRAQLVVTTHSPQVLDILDDDQLDNIIICDFIEGKGTQLRKLTSLEKSKALDYMSTDYLSDYWKYSDLNI